MNILIVTACGVRKDSGPMPAHKLYKSTRIKAVSNRRGGCDMAILSAEYGLVKSQKVISPYERVMDEQRAEELTTSVAKNLKEYDCIVFFKGGARKAYQKCIRTACEKAGKTLVTLGFGNMGGIRDLPRVLGLLREGKLDKIREIEHVQLLINSTENKLIS